MLLVFFSLMSYPSNPSFFFNLIFKTSGREGSRQNDSREWCWEAMSCQCRNCVLSDEVHNSLSSLLNPAHSCSFRQYHSFKSSLSLLQHDFTQTFHCLQNLGQAMHCIAIFKNHAAFSSLHQLSKSMGEKKKKKWSLKLHVILQKPWAAFQIARKYQGSNGNIFEVLFTIFLSSFLLFVFLPSLLYYYFNCSR